MLLSFPSKELSASSVFNVVHAPDSFELLTILAGSFDPSVSPPLLILIDRPLLQHTHHLLPHNMLLLRTIFKSQIHSVNQILPSQTQQPLQQINGNGISGAALKTYRWEILSKVLSLAALTFSSPFLLSIDSEDGERGVTFRVGKFIGQVSIESEWKTFGRFSSWRQMLLQAWSSVVSTGCSCWSACWCSSSCCPSTCPSPAGPATWRTPTTGWGWSASCWGKPHWLTGGWNTDFGSLKTSLRHNDLPWNIRQFVHNKIKTVNFSSDLSQVNSRPCYCTK